MATSLAVLLDLTSSHARDLTPTPSACAYVAGAMRHYGRALTQCSVGDPAQPGHGHAEHLAAACHRFPSGTHQQEQRLGRLAGAAADTIAVLLPELTPAGRWAIIIAIADTPTALCD